MRNKNITLVFSASLVLLAQNAFLQSKGYGGGGRGGSRSSHSYRPNSHSHTSSNASKQNTSNKNNSQQKEHGHQNVSSQVPSSVLSNPSYTNTLLAFGIGYAIAATAIHPHRSIYNNHYYRNEAEAKQAQEVAQCMCIED